MFLPVFILKRPINLPAFSLGRYITKVIVTNNYNNYIGITFKKVLGLIACLYDCYFVRSLARRECQEHNSTSSYAHSGEYQGRRMLPRASGTKLTWEGTYEGSLGLYSFFLYMKGFGRIRIKRFELEGSSWLRASALLDFKNWGGGGGLVWANKFSKLIT